MHAFSQLSCRLPYLLLLFAGTKFSDFNLLLLCFHDQCLNLAVIKGSYNAMKYNRLILSLFHQFWAVIL